jgi:monoamine oxidase
MALTRRQFLLRVGQAGGYGAAFTMMQTLGLLPIAASKAQSVRGVTGHGTRVVILGGGIAGLASAYEMTKLGYSCTVLEARDRVGGRNWTIRRGSRVTFTDGTEQVCNFEDGLYFNAGPARLPSIHNHMLNYCHELGVPLEVEINTTRSSLMQADSFNGGKPIQQRQMVNDTRGHVSELLAKCIQQGALDQDLDAEDKERMLKFLAGYGDLTPEYRFAGTARSGYKISPDAGPQDGVANDPLPMHALLDADLWYGLLTEDMIDWQATMFQPVGGMDQIPRAFEKKLGSTIRHNAEVMRIRQSDKGVRVSYKDRVSGSVETIDADYCICAMPLVTLKNVDADFSPEVAGVLDHVAYDSAYKIAWQSRRFWEQENNIYGGLSFLRQTVDVVWYPSYNLFSPNGAIVSGYSIENGSPFGQLPSIEAKLAASRNSVEKLFPGRGNELRDPIYVSWGQIPFNLGSWISAPRPNGPRPRGAFLEQDPHDYAIMTRPDRRVYFAGDHTSHLVGWQEGAACSAIRAVNMIGERVGADSHVG